MSRAAIGCRTCSSATAVQAVGQAGVSPPGDAGFDCRLRTSHRMASTPTATTTSQSTMAIAIMAATAPDPCIIQSIPLCIMVFTCCLSTDTATD